MRTIKVGVVGYGISAKVFHIPFITTLKEFELVSIVERKTNEAQIKFPEVRIARSLDDLLKNDEVELVVITTPNETHFPFAEAALKAGRHVVLEKPFTISLDEANSLVALAKKTDKLLSVYQNRRYVSDYLTIKKILEENLLGDIHEFEAHYDRYRLEARPQAWREAPKPGSGIFYDLGPHLVDQVFSLFGIPLSVTADIRMQRPHARVDDFFNLWLDYPFGKVILHASMMIREPGPRYMLHGTLGSFIKYGEDVQEAALRAGQLPTTPGWGIEPEHQYGLIHTEKEGRIIKEKFPSLPGNYGQYYENLYDAIVNGQPCKERPEHGYNTIRLIQQAFESSDRKCTVQCTDYLEVPY